MGLIGSIASIRRGYHSPILPKFLIFPMPLPTSISMINFLSEAVRCGASKKGLPEDSTSSTASGSQLFKHVPQIAAYHKKL